jgi:hypothetical protein
MTAVAHQEEWKRSKPGVPPPMNAQGFDLGIHASAVCESLSLSLCHYGVATTPPASGCWSSGLT